MFSDDAYNKYLGGPQAGTLIGNWAEERSIRDATGEGRSVPMRHIPRSGLLVDWTKVPSTGPRKQDNTFERVYGPKFHLKDVPQSKTVGAGEADLTGEKPISEMLQAEGRIPRVGPKEIMDKTTRISIADEEVMGEDAIRDLQAQERYFDTSHRVTYAKPDETQAERAAHLRKSYKNELMHGPAPSRSQALLNAGLEVQTNVHYSNIEGVTHNRMSLADPLMRNDMAVSACSGKSSFGKNAQFSTPVQHFLKGLCKDDEMAKIYTGLQSTDSVRLLNGAKPHASAFAGVPSLTALKETIHNRVAQKFGAHGYVLLRQKLYDVSDHEGFLKISEVSQILRTDLGLTQEDISSEALEVYLDQLATMKKLEVRASSFMTSLRPLLPQKMKRRVMQRFNELQPVNGAVKLGTWLSQLNDAELKSTLVTAFGGYDEESVADTPLTEQVFLELLSDLAPFADVEALLV